MRRANILWRIFSAASLMIVMTFMFTAHTLASEVTEAGDSNVNVQYWQVISAFLLSGVIIPFLIQADWKQTTKAVVAFIVSVVWTTIGLFLKNELDVHNWVSASLMIFALAIPFYYGFWKPTGVAPTIEEKTTLNN